MCRLRYPGDRRKPPEGVTLTGVIRPDPKTADRAEGYDQAAGQGRHMDDGTGYGLHSGESHEEVGAEGAKRAA